MCRGVHGGAIPASAAHHKALPHQAPHLAATHPHLGQAPITGHADHSFLCNRIIRMTAGSENDTTQINV